MTGVQQRKINGKKLLVGWNEWMRDVCAEWKGKSGCGRYWGSSASDLEGDWKLRSQGCVAEGAEELIDFG